MSEIVLRIDTAANWATADPVLADGEPAWDSTNEELYIGNGTDNFSALTPISGGGGGGTWGSITGTLSAQTDLDTALSGKQPLDGDLTTIAGLTATTNNMIQSVGSAWASRTPAQVKTALAIAESDVTNLVTDLAAKQPLDSDLTTIAGLTATTDNMIQSVGSAWASRTPAQVKTALAIAESDVASLVTDLAAKAPLASPTFTGTVTLPTGLTGIAKLASGVVSAATAGTDYTSPTSTETQTNKRRTPRVFSTASTATLTPEIDTYDAFTITAQAAALNIANHSTSTPANFEQMRIRILDNGTARAITYGSNYSNRGGNALPSTTIVSKFTELGFEWFAAISLWVLTSLVQE